MTIEEIDKEIKAVESQVRPLKDRLYELRRKRAELASKQFIAANKITKADVEMSSGEGKPWFGSVDQFRDLLKKQPKLKRFAEWNERIYFTTDILQGKLPQNDMPATIRELTE